MSKVESGIPAYYIRYIYTQRFLSSSMPLQKAVRKIRSLFGGATEERPLVDQVYPDDTFLVSYPRSGNSFLQHLICNYLYPDGFESTPSVIPDLHMNPELASEIDRPRILKSHEKIPQPYPNVIYVARDGRDVAISYHAFLQRSGKISDDLSLEDFVASFNDGKYEFGCWNDHVVNWLGAHSDSLVVRYEDMLTDGDRELRRVLEFLGHPVNEDQVSSAVEKSQFSRLQRKEKERVREKDSGDPDEKNLFFRKGEKCQWKSHFSEEMNAEFVRLNREALRKLNYIDG
jgi:hypothetical protein